MAALPVDCVPHTLVPSEPSVEWAVGPHLSSSRRALSGSALFRPELWEEAVASRPIRPGAWGADDALWLHVFRQRWARHCAGLGGVSEQPRIPLVVHQIWLGSEPVPARLTALRESWWRRLPDWDYRLWTDETAAMFPFTRPELYAAARTPVERCGAP